jgi:virginiamycin B lyase
MNRHLLLTGFLLASLFVGCEPTPVEFVIPDGLGDANEPFTFVVEEFPVPSGSRPHDVTPALDGGVWYTAQRQEALGYLDPQTGETRHIFLGDGAAPHGVIVGPDGFPWITDGGLNAIVNVDPATDMVSVFPLPVGTSNANLNTATFDNNSVLWFTGQNGIYGRLDPAVGQVEVFEAPRGRGPYGIATTPDGEVYYVSLSDFGANALVRFDPVTETFEVIELPSPRANVRQILGRPGEIWGGESGADKLVVVRTRFGLTGGFQTASKA